MSHHKKEAQVISIETAFLRFFSELEALTGVKNPVTKIGLNPVALDRIVYDFHARRGFGAARPSDIAELRLFGVELVPRVEEKF